MNKTLQRIIWMSAIVVTVGMMLWIAPGQITEMFSSSPEVLDPIALTVPEHFKEQGISIDKPSEGQWGKTNVSLNPLSIRFEAFQDGVAYTVVMTIPTEKPPETIQQENNWLYLAEVKKDTDLEIFFYDGYILPKVILKSESAPREFEIKLEGYELSPQSTVHSPQSTDNSPQSQVTSHKSPVTSYNPARIETSVSL